MKKITRGQLAGAFDDITGRPDPALASIVQRNLRARAAAARSNDISRRLQIAIAAILVVATAVGIEVWINRSTALSPATTEQSPAILKGTVRVVAGDGTPGQHLSGDGGPAVKAVLGTVSAATVDRRGNLYLASNALGGSGSVGAIAEIRKVDANTGIISRVGPGFRDIAITGLAVDSHGNVFFAVASRDEIREVDAATGGVVIVAGGGARIAPNAVPAVVPAMSASLSSPTSLALDAAGNLLIADTYNNQVRELTADHSSIKRVAGDGTAGDRGDGSAAANAALNQPMGVAVDAQGDVFIADTSNNKVRMVLASTGVISTIAGNAGVGDSVSSGPATTSALRLPAGVALDAKGDVFIADTGNHVVREIPRRSSTMWQVAGDGRAPQTTDDNAKQLQSLPAMQAEFHGPQSVVVDSHGALFIIDDNLVRELVASSS